MKKFALVLIVAIAGCSQSSTTAGGGSVATANVEPQLSETTVDDIALSPKAILNGKFELLVPDGFSIMDEDVLKMKYPSERRPTIVYTNNSGAVNVAINHTENLMPRDKIAEFHTYMDQMFRNLYPSATWYDSSVININGREWFSLNLQTPAIDTKIRNIMAGTSVEGRLLLVTVNFTTELEQQWLGAGEAIIQSLRIVD